MKLNISQLGVISNIGATRLDQAIDLATECSVLDATGDDLAYVDLADGEILEIFKNKGILSEEEYTVVEASDVLTLMLTA